MRAYRVEQLHTASHIISFPNQETALLKLNQNPYLEPYMSGYRHKNHPEITVVHIGSHDYDVRLSHHFSNWKIALHQIIDHLK